MYSAFPIVEKVSGELEFLHGSDRPGGQSRIASREEPFPDVESLKLVQRGLRAQSGPWEKYSEARVANNLAAVYLSLDKPSEALQATADADAVIREMFDSSNPYPINLTFVGFCVAQYHTCMIYARFGGDDANSGEKRRLDTLSLIDDNEHRYRVPDGVPQRLAPSRASIDFVQSALSSLRISPAN